MARALTTFVVAYLVAITAACFWRADYLLRDAVLSLPVITLMFWVALAPIGIAGTLCLLVTDVPTKVRIGLALAFGVIVFVAAAVLTSPNPPGSYESARHGWIVLISTYVVVAVAYACFAMLAHKYLPARRNLVPPN